MLWQITRVASVWKHTTEHPTSQHLSSLNMLQFTKTYLDILELQLTVTLTHLVHIIRKSKDPLKNIITK